MTGKRGARRYWIAPVLAFALLFGAGDVLRAGAAERPVVLQWSRFRPDMITGIETKERVVALSFDDGPDPRYTPAVLDTLDRFGMKATFFLEGDHVDAHGALARQVQREGHELGNHSYDHPDLPPLDFDAVLDQVTRTNRAFTKAGLDEPTLFRPPRGQFDQEAADAVRRARLITAGWTGGLCVEKWTGSLPPREAADALLARVRPGAILLGHDGGSHDRAATVEALPLVLQGLRDRGYKVVTVGELLGLRK